VAEAPVQRSNDYSFDLFPALIHRKIRLIVNILRKCRDVTIFFWENSLFYTRIPVKKINKYIFLLLILSIIIGSSCSASKKSNCGCPSKKGMVGY
jgi:hypothetical protein